MDIGRPIEMASIYTYDSIQRDVDRTYVYDDSVLEQTRLSFVFAGKNAQYIQLLRMEIGDD